MKIGILTQPLHTNYGGLLQNFALQMVLKKMGHDVITLDWKNKEAPLSFRQRLARTKGVIFSLFQSKQILTGKSFYSFKNDNIKSTRKITKEGEFALISEQQGIEAFIVGSDQCWRPLYSFPYLEEMFLSFAKDKKDIKRIAYAASFGTDDWEFTEKQTAECSALVQLFDSVTVRESSGIDLCRKYLNINASLVLDPTLLLTQSDYSALLQDESSLSNSGSLYYYVLDSNNEIYQFIKHVSDITGFNPYFVSIVNKNIKDCPGEAIEPSVYSWIKGFQDAKMTIVDSFHGMVFSIIFNKPFWVVGNKTRGMSRFESLLKLLGLEDRLVNLQKGDSVDLNRPIDWKLVSSKLEILRKSSLDILNNALNNG